jgi:mono/diheme cytochrome c family protein
MRGALLLATLALAACDDMTSQPKKAPYADASVGPGAAPDGAVQFDTTARPTPPLSLALLQRGKERFEIFCTPCHSELGDGQGMVVQRGFSPPPSYDIDRLRGVPTQHFYDVVTNGFGAMYSFAQRIPPDDRWAIAAYIRALQLSQDTKLSELTPAQRSALP